MKTNCFTKQIIRFSLLSLVAVATMSSLTGCASGMKAWKNLVGAREEDPLSQVKTPRFSENEDMKVTSDKQYRRMNRQRFEDEADLKADAGSLWVMEGQGAYLFSQNQMRMVGDLLNVKLEGAPRSQLTTKVKVISKLLERLENPARGLASSPNGAAAPQADAAAAPAADGAQKTADAAAAPGADAAAAGAPAKDNLSVQTVPTRIIEQMKDGSYRVRGQQPFMIGKREYKVIVTGVVRPEDFDDAGIEAGKLLDPQFDIVSARKGATL